MLKHCLVQKILSSNLILFSCLLDLWCEILSLVDRENQSFQSKNISVDTAFKQLSGLFTLIQNLQDQGIDNIISATKVMAKKIGIHPALADKRKHKAKCVALEEAKNENLLLTPVNDFERQSKAVIDSILTQLQWCFELMSKVSSDFNFLSGESFSSLSVKQLKMCSHSDKKIYE